jgi:hypothetical protein
MAFPATYNISYYRGDTFDFVVNPKNPNGQSFNLDGYSALFTIATEAGDPSKIVDTGSASVNSITSQIICQIAPSLGSTLTGSSYVYDLEIYNETSSAVYTLLRGTIGVTPDISRTGQ